MWRRRRLKAIYLDNVWDSNAASLAYHNFTTIMTSNTHTHTYTHKQVKISFLNWKDNLDHVIQDICSFFLTGLFFFVNFFPHLYFYTYRQSDFTQLHIFFNI